MAPRTAAAVTECHRVLTWQALCLPLQQLSRSSFKTRMAPWRSLCEVSRVLCGLKFSLPCVIAHGAHVSSKSCRVKLLGSSAGAEQGWAASWLFSDTVRFQRLSVFISEAGTVCHRRRHQAPWVGVFIFNFPGP